MLDFPSSPTTGQIFTAGGTIWKFDSVKWLAQGAASQYLLGFDLPGLLTAGAVFAHVFAAGASFPVNFSGSRRAGRPTPPHRRSSPSAKLLPPAR